MSEKMTKDVEAKYIQQTVDGKFMAHLILLDDDGNELPIHNSIVWEHGEPTEEQISAFVKRSAPDLMKRKDFNQSRVINLTEICKDIEEKNAAEGIPESLR